MDAKGHAAAWQHAENALRRQVLTATESDRAAFAAAYQLAGYVAKGYTKVYLDDLTAAQQKEAELDEEDRKQFMQSGEASGVLKYERKAELNKVDAERNGLDEDKIKIARQQELEAAAKRRLADKEDAP